MAITNTKLVYEVIEMAGKVRSKKDKIEILKKHESWALRDLLKGMYDDRIQWNLPEGAPPYEPNEGHNAPSNFLKENTKLKYFVKNGPYKDMNPLKRERMFIGILEGIHPRDAELLIKMKDKIPLKEVPKVVVQDAFPGLLG